MTFEVKYRNKQGATEYLRVDAGSRAEVFAVLKNRGITSVIQVTDATGKKPRKAATTGAPISGKIKGLVALVAVVVIGVVAYLLVPEDEKPVAEPKPEKPKKIEIVKPAEVVKPVEPEPAPEKPKIDPEKAARAAKIRAMTPAERLEFLFEEAKKKPIDFTTSTNRPFATGTEQVMSWIFTTRLGNMPPPLPKIPIRDEAHMAEILLADNPALEGDSDKVKEAKEMVELAKKECIEFVKKGGDVTEFLEYYRGELMQAHQEWQASQKTVMQVIREEPEIAGEFIKEVNSRLAEKGIKPVNIPPKIRQELGLED